MEVSGLDKREEIREGIIKKLSRVPGFSYSPDVITDEILQYLHSQGVVMKVDGDLPENIEGCDWINQEFIVDNCPLLRAGYCKTEPLIGGEKTDNIPH